MLSLCKEIARLRNNTVWYTSMIPWVSDSWSSSCSSLEIESALSTVSLDECEPAYDSSSSSSSSSVMASVNSYKLVDEVLTRLGKAGLKCKMSKCKFFAKEFDYLGHVITQEGITPCQKKIEAILKIEVPRTVKQLCRFIGMVNYYRDMYPKRSELISIFISEQDLVTLLQNLGEGSITN
jgi:hypothetical protein